MNLCKYKNILGEPNKGIHSFRIGGIAYNDVIITFIFAFIISYVFHYKFWKTLLILLFIGIILHRIFCVKTTIDKFLFTKF